MPVLAALMFAHPRLLEMLLMSDSADMFNSSRATIHIRQQARVERGIGNLDFRVRSPGCKILALCCVWCGVNF